LADIDKTKHNCQEQQKSINKHAEKLWTCTKTKANKTKAWFKGLVCHLASSQGSHGMIDRLSSVLG